MQRKSFLCGLGAGILFGIGVVSLANSIGRPVSVSAPGTVAPKPVVHVVPVIENDNPSHWHRREFNGRPYYIVPLHKGTSQI